MNRMPRPIKWISSLFYMGLLTAGCIVIILFFFIFYGSERLPRVPHPLARIIETPKTQIYAATGEKLITLGKKKPVPLSRISPHFINAILAVEDHRFMRHSGLNKSRTLKALYITLIQPGKIQGASTITQQLAKNLFFSFKQTYLRKFKELLVALQIEHTFSKEEILHAYVNQIAFGAGAQGVERAARVFFNKPASDLTLAEATLLAGLPQSPTRYNPLRHYDRALKRREVVIRRMVATGYLTRKKAQQVLQENPTLSIRHRDSEIHSYFLDTVITRLIQRYGKDVVFHGGIRVTTTLDSAMQRAARASVTKGIAALDADPGIDNTPETIPQAALVAVDTDSGAVKAFMGKRECLRSQFNGAGSEKCQAGSSFAPFIYYAAMEKLNIHGGTEVRAPREVTPPFKKEKVLNTGHLPREHMILKQSMTVAGDRIALQLLEKTSLDSVISTARICGIKSPITSSHTRGVFAAQVTPEEMASAYATFASGGIQHDPFFIRRVEDAQGDVIYEHLIQNKEVLDAATAFQVVDMMQCVVDKGPAQQVRQQGFFRPAAGQTGTEKGDDDAWFTGFTPEICTSVWIGYDTAGKTKTHAHSATTCTAAAVSIWTSFMSQALGNEPVRSFRIPDNITFKSVDALTGCPPATGDTATFVVPLKPDQTICGDTP
ncbi:penicillin-binding protein 1A [Desulfocicer vacuolatum DSM 3385]|uniref:Penicillin-binding protein 1A n=1 Tax=Desulfocicer vacuolatum DSM 3385 TaxID=1121400 RepID=A0A1W2D832_9BACT|nr:transglycosylase domain-containing protein [Desulfocicer vacuolatum]SMC93677.1 penicillin-binding protein 1A [Desulfocicer vacuolatum DSM 3385]